MYLFVSKNARTAAAGACKRIVIVFCPWWNSLRGEQHQKRLVLNFKFSYAEALLMNLSRANDVPT